MSSTSSESASVYCVTILVSKEMWSFHNWMGLLLTHDVTAKESTGSKLKVLANLFLYTSRNQERDSEKVVFPHVLISKSIFDFPLLFNKIS